MPPSFSLSLYLALALSVSHSVSMHDYYINISELKFFLRCFVNTSTISILPKPIFALFLAYL